MAALVQPSAAAMPAFPANRSIRNPQSAMQYLLPCQCGQKLPVDASQAGLRVRCACGAEPQVPTLRGLAALERATATSSAATAPGSLGAATSGRLSGPVDLSRSPRPPRSSLWLTFPKFPDFQFDPMDRQAIEQYVNGLSVQESLELFEYDAAGHAQRVGELPPIAEYQAKATVHRRYLLAMAITAGVGALLLLGSLVMERK